MKTAQLIINAAAGSVKRHSNLTDRILRAAEESDIDIAARVVKPKRLMGALRSAANTRPDLLMIAGGDGSIKAAARIAIDTDITLAILPLGTMNLLPKDLGLPMDPIAAARAIFNGGERRIDIAEANGNMFLHSAILGPVARFGIYRERLRKRNAISRQAHSIWRGMRLAWRAKPTTFTINTHNDITTESHCCTGFALAISANRLKLRRPAPYARLQLDAGQLCVYQPKDIEFPSLPRTVVELGTGTWTEGPALEHPAEQPLLVHTGKHSTIVSIDGEPTRLHCPIEFRLIPKALRVATPNPDAQPNTRPYA